MLVSWSQMNCQCSLNQGKQVGMVRRVRVYIHIKPIVSLHCKSDKYCVQPSRSEFYKTLRERLDKYFKDNKIVSLCER